MDDYGKDNVRKIVRLMVLAVSTGVVTGATAYITALQQGQPTKTTTITAVLGGVVSMCGTISSGLSDAPGGKKI